MEFNLAKDLESRKRNGIIEHEFWPLEEVDINKAKFPCCLVWTPLPVVSWLAPFIGHVGLCKEDGTILDFSGSNLINVNDFAFGPVARYLQLNREQVSSRHYENKSYNIFTRNCHSFVAHCLNRLSYEGSMGWNMVNVAALVFVKGKWVDGTSVLRSFLPFVVVLCMGVYVLCMGVYVGCMVFVDHLYFQERG